VFSFEVLGADAESGAGSEGPGGRQNTRVLIERVQRDLGHVARHFFLFLFFSFFFFFFFFFFVCFFFFFFFFASFFFFFFIFYFFFFSLSSLSSLSAPLSGAVGLAGGEDGVEVGPGVEVDVVLESKSVFGAHVLLVGVGRPGALVLAAALGCPLALWGGPPLEVAGLPAHVELDVNHAAYDRVADDLPPGDTSVEARGVALGKIDLAVIDRPVYGRVVDHDGPSVALRALEEVLDHRDHYPVGDGDHLPGALGEHVLARVAPLPLLRATGDGAARAVVAARPVKGLPLEREAKGARGEKGVGKDVVAPAPLLVDAAHVGAGADALLDALARRSAALRGRHARPRGEALPAAAARSRRARHHRRRGVARAGAVGTATPRDTAGAGAGPAAETTPDLAGTADIARIVAALATDL
jgi:hypothetical protein